MLCDPLRFGGFEAGFFFFFFFFFFFLWESQI